MTNIEWTDETWNPVRGCTRVSPGCEHCYAERQAIRHAGAGGSYEGLVKITNGHPQWTGKILPVESAIEDPLHWKRPRRVFVNSMSDLFHEGIPREFLFKIFDVMVACPQHTFQILTKRPEHMVQVMPFVWDYCRVSEPPKHIQLGVSVETQPYANKRIPHLLNTPAVVRFLSIEPQLEAIDITQHFWGRVTACPKCPHDADCECGYATRPMLGEPAISWVICGGESGPGARPFNISWAETLLAQCRAAGVPFFLKQIGARPYRDQNPIGRDGTAKLFAPFAVRDRKGGDPSEWPEHLRVREFPMVGS